jgi:hypothetical protein
VTPLFLHVTTQELLRANKEFGCKEMVMTITLSSGNSSKLGGTLSPEAKVYIVLSLKVLLISQLPKNLQCLLAISSMEVPVVSTRLR